MNYRNYAGLEKTREKTYGPFVVVGADERCPSGQLGRGVLVIHGVSCLLHRIK